MPSHLPRDLSTSISVALNGIHGDERFDYWLSERCRPSPSVMQALTTRLSEIRGATVKDFPEPIIQELQDTFDVMASSQSANPQNRAKVYLVEISDLPVWAVAKVLRQFRRGEIGDGRFAPTPAEIRKHVASVMDGLAEEARRIERVLLFWGPNSPALAEAASGKRAGATSLGEMAKHYAAKPGAEE